MKKLLLFLSFIGGMFLTQKASAQCQAAFVWEQIPNTLSIHFFNQSTSEHDITSYLWNFGDNHTGDGQNPTHTYGAPGVYNVCLTIHDNVGCESTICHEVTVEAINSVCEAAFTFEINQQTNTVHFDDNSFSNHDITSYFWTFGDGETSTLANPTHIYTNPGTYTVCLTITDNTGCTDDVCHTVTILEDDDCHAEFSIEATGDPFTFNFFDESTSDHDIATWVWHFGDDQSSNAQDPSHTYDEPGTYTVCLIITSETGCVADHCETLVVTGNEDGCNAEFAGEPGDNSQTWHFFDQSTSEHDIVSWQWSFGDGGTSDDHSPIHHYENPGTYTVCLTITSATGCVSEHCETIVVTEQEDGCHAEFGGEPGDNSQTWHFFDQSTSEHDIVSWQWSFGDGGTSDNQNPIHHYENPGTYTVCLIITSETGCVSDHCETITVTEQGDGCHAEFNFEHNQNGNVYHFFDQSTSEHQIVSWQWSFGDGGTSTEQNPVHEYANPGTYTVCLIITSETGCVADHCETIVVQGEGDGCHAEFSGEHGENNHIWHFNDQSTSEHQIVSWQWSFGDGGTSNEQNPVHEYANPGVYLVCLIITSETGCVADHCEEIVVTEGNGEGCHALFTFDVGNELTVHFFNQSTSDHDIIQYIWNFGDGHMGDGQFPVHHYDQPGTYEVCLTIVDNSGCEDTYCHLVEVGEPVCEVNFEWTFNEETDSLQFINNSSGATPSTIWLWDFGDDTFSVEENPQHEYTQNGIYNICLFMIDTTTNCNAHKCHTYVQMQEPEEENENYEEYQGNQNLGTPPSIKFTNPADQRMTINYSLMQKGDVTIYLYDLSGKRVMTEDFGLTLPGEYVRTITLPNVPQGIYSIIFDIGNTRVTNHVMIAK